MSLPPSILEHTPWENESNPIWPASSFVLHRNLAKHLFPPKLGEMQAGQVLHLVKEALQFPHLLEAEKLSLLDKEFIYEHFLAFEGFQNTVKGQGFILDDSGEMLAIVNIQDHLQIELVDTKGEWEKAWNKLSALDSSLKLDFAFSPRFGYLTSDPLVCGTGLLIYVYLHLPALIHTGQLEDALIKQKEEEVVATSLMGNLEEIAGDMIVLTNDCTVGLSEENILHELHISAMKLVGTEKALRAHLAKENNVEIKDQIARAYGLLLHSYQLKTKETLDALSLIKLGIDLGWVKGMTDKKINEIFFKCRSAHLSYEYKEKAFNPTEAAQKRAAYIHKEIEKVTLV